MPITQAEFKRQTQKLSPHFCEDMLDRGVTADQFMTLNAVRLEQMNALYCRVSDLLKQYNGAQDAWIAMLSGALEGIPAKCAAILTEDATDAEREEALRGLLENGSNTCVQAEELQAGQTFELEPEGDIRDREHSDQDEKPQPSCLLLAVVVSVGGAAITSVVSAFPFICVAALASTPIGLFIGLGVVLGLAAVFGTMVCSFRAHNQSSCKMKVFDSDKSHENQHLTGPADRGGYEQ